MHIVNFYFCPSVGCTAKRFVDKRKHIVNPMSQNFDEILLNDEKRTRRIFYLETMFKRYFCLKVNLYSHIHAEVVNYEPG